MKSGIHTTYDRNTESEVYSEYKKNSYFLKNILKVSIVSVCLSSEAEAPRPGSQFTFGQSSPP